MPNEDSSITVHSAFVSKQQKMSEKIAAAVSASDPNEEVTVDVMIVYTQEARAWADANGGINSVINQAMAMAQQVLDNSKTFLKIKLVHSSFVAYSEKKILKLTLIILQAYPTSSLTKCMSCAKLMVLI
ncbi:MAG TPA: hypothetical protein VLS45_06260 [Methylomicrobium sp.]|nr:hypothetical protein [Methylomicrobium sp.]